MADEPDAVAEAERQALIRRAEALRDQAQELSERLEAQIEARRPSRLAIAGRVTALFGIPLAGGVAVWLLLDSWLFAGITPFVLFVPTFLVLERLIGGPRAPGIGTRGWEAQQNVSLLDNVITARRAELSHADDPDPIRREIAHLKEQRLKEIALLGDTGPGRGYVGFDAYSED